MQGDANGKTEMNAGYNANVDDCAEKCMGEKLKDQTINAVSFGVNSRAGECYCEREATSADGRATFKACFFS